MVNLPPVEKWRFVGDYAIDVAIGLTGAEEMRRDHLVRTLKGIESETGSIIDQMKGGLEYELEASGRDCEERRGGILIR